MKAYTYCYLHQETRFKTPDLPKYVCIFKDRLQNANNNLKQTQKDMKSRYDTKTKVRVFKPGDKVLIFLPIPGRPLNARYQSTQLSSKNS